MQETASTQLIQSISSRPISQRSIEDCTCIRNFLHSRSSHTAFFALWPLSLQLELARVLRLRKGVLNEVIATVHLSG